MDIIYLHPTNKNNTYTFTLFIYIQEQYQNKYQHKTNDRKAYYVYEY